MLIRLRSAPDTRTELCLPYMTTSEVTTMRISTLLGSAALTVAFGPALLSAAAWADGPRSAYDNGGVSEASLDPGEEQMTADEENKARLKDLSDAYHSGYNARAKEDADTYASLREQLKHTSKASAQQPPPLPSDMPSDDNARYRSAKASTLPASLSKRSPVARSGRLRASSRMSAVIICKLFLTRCWSSRSWVSFSITWRSNSLRWLSEGLALSLDKATNRNVSTPLSS